MPLTVGTSYASVPLRLLPPQPPEPEAVGKDAKKGKPAAVAGGKGAAVEQTGTALLARGVLKLRLSITALEETRDWLRKGEIECAPYLQINVPAEAW